MRTALVIGGGVAGPVTAIALQRAGFEAVVYEARPDADDDRGAFLTLQVNGVAALRALGMGEALAGLGFATPAMRFRSGSGKLLGAVSTGEPLPDGTVGVTLRRSDLYRALRDRGPAARHPGRARAPAGRRRAIPRGTRAVFADGGTADGELLIGADGIRSRVRGLIDPQARPARYVPVLNTGGYAPPQELDVPPGHYEMIFGRRAFFLYAVAPDGTVWWGANPPRRDEPAPGELAAMSERAVAVLVAGAVRAGPDAGLLDHRRHPRPARRVGDLRPALGQALAPRPHDRHRGRGARHLAGLRPGRVDGHRGRGRAGPLPA